MHHQGFKHTVHYKTDCSGDHAKTSRLKLLKNLFELRAEEEKIENEASWVPGLGRCISLYGCDILFYDQLKLAGFRRPQERPRSGKKSRFLKAFRALKLGTRSDFHKLDFRTLPESIKSCRNPLFSFQLVSHCILLMRNVYLLRKLKSRWTPTSVYSKWMSAPNSRKTDQPDSVRAEYIEWR